MDVSLVLQQFQYAIPIVVLVCAVLVFVFGFKNAEQPPFAHLSAATDVDRKQASKKRSKIKDKKSTVNPIAAAVEKSEKSVKKTSPAKTETVKKSSGKNEDVEGKLKERKEENTQVVAVNAVAKKEKSQVNAKSGKENKAEQTKNKKNLKNQVLEKPLDFDDGDWEQAFSKKNKRLKKEEETTPKKTKKSAKKSEFITDAKDAKNQEKIEIKDKVAKETENKELKEKNQKDVILEPVVEKAVAPVEIVPEKKEQVKEQIPEVPEKEEKKSAKSKKAKKSSNKDAENIPAAVVPAPVEKKSPVKVAAEKKPEPVVVAKTETVQEAPKVAQTVEQNAAVFDELGDVWKEAKPQKKGKKKARKDN